MVDIETLNRRAFQGELELTAVSVHAYAYLDRPLRALHLRGEHGRPLRTDGRRQQAVAARGTCQRTIAVPGTLTTAYLALRLCLGADFAYVVVPFDQILDATLAGEYQGRTDRRRTDHPRRPTHLRRQRLQLVVDYGPWWFEQTGLPLPLGANGFARTWAPRHSRRPPAAEREHPLRPGASREALDYALTFGRGLDRAKADQFVEMYVNDWTLDFGPPGAKRSPRCCAVVSRRGSCPAWSRPVRVLAPNGNSPPFASFIHAWGQAYRIQF